MNAETFPRPDAPRGVGPVVWRCTCRRLWCITETPLTRGQVLADRRVWSRAGWVVRWRYRHATALDQEQQTAVWESKKRPPAGPSGVSRSRRGA